MSNTENNPPETQSAQPQPLEPIDSKGPSWESELDVYPLRPPEEDPRWAMWVFWIWVVFCTAMIVFLAVITVAGWFFD